MAGMCCGVVGESETGAPVEPSSRGSRRRRMEIRQLKFIADMPPVEERRKRQRVEVYNCENRETEKPVDEPNRSEKTEIESGSNPGPSNDESAPVEEEAVRDRPKFGMTSVCGRRRDMEDAVSIHPSFCGQDTTTHFFGVFDGHGCSHVAMRCRDRLHEIVKGEVELESGGESVEWKDTLSRSFEKMDKEVHEYISDVSTAPNCRCELRTPQCDAVGSTAVVAIVTPDKIIVSNCGDSRAVLSRNGVAIPLSSDHKPDRPDELARIESAGGRVIYWDGARVLGVLAMSRAIGDNYLKPYVISEPEVMVIDRTPEDECLILGSDGLWDVVSNDTASGVARMCLKAQKPPPSPPGSPGSGGLMSGGDTAQSSDKACSDASILLTKLALARHSTDNVSVVVVDLRKDGVHIIS